MEGLRFLPSFAAVTGATVLIAEGFDHGWGWLLFVALLLMPSTSTAQPNHTGD